MAVDADGFTYDRMRVRWATTEHVEISGSEYFVPFQDPELEADDPAGSRPGDVVVIYLGSSEELSPPTGFTLRDSRFYDIEHEDDEEVVGPLFLGAYTRRLQPDDFPVTWPAQFATGNVVDATLIYMAVFVVSGVMDESTMTFNFSELAYEQVVQAPEVTGGKVGLTALFIKREPRVTSIGPPMDGVEGGGLADPMNDQVTHVLVATGGSKSIFSSIPADTITFWGSDSEGDIDVVDIITPIFGQRRYVGEVHIDGIGTQPYYLYLYLLPTPTFWPLWSEPDVPLQSATGGALPVSNAGGGRVEASFDSEIDDTHIFNSRSVDESEADGCWVFIAVPAADFPDEFLDIVGQEGHLDSSLFDEAPGANVLAVSTGGATIQDQTLTIHTAGGGGSEEAPALGVWVRIDPPFVSTLVSQHPGLPDSQLRGEVYSRVFGFYLGVMQEKDYDGTIGGVGEDDAWILTGEPYRTIAMSVTFDESGRLAGEGADYVGPRLPIT